MSTSLIFDRLHAEAVETQKQTGDMQVVSYIEHLQSSSSGLETLLNHKIDDPITVLRKHWDQMAEVAATLLKEIDSQQRTREETLRKSANDRAVHNKTHITPGPVTATLTTGVVKSASAMPDFAAVGQQVKALQKESERKIEEVASTTRQVSSNLRAGLLASVSALRADAHRLRWVLRRMKLARLASGAIRALVSVMTFLALYALLLWLHHPFAEFAQDLMQGTLAAFVLLAALLLPIELVKAFLIEPTLHSWLHLWERTRTRGEFDKLITLLARTRFAIARANA